jgi:hypothetical protein
VTMRRIRRRRRIRGKGEEGKEDSLQKEGK